MSVVLKSAVFYTEPTTEQPCPEIYEVAKRDQGNETELPVILIRHGCKSYRKGVPVLEDLNMTIKRGIIYALLGSSGSGKSTTLSCILGLTRLSNGNLWVFGKVPGSSGNGGPRTCVGFMPQDYSLYREYTIEQTFMYLGRLNGLDNCEIKKAMKFYSELLSLPSLSSYIHSLSGGQKRRVSLSLALIHKPRVLILDEPTVGLDPVLRESVWTHLHYLTKTMGSTVVVTSHYIEEARYSDMIGVLRHGRLIAEQPPASLLEEYKTHSLQTVVLQLCHGNNNNNNGNFEKNANEGNVDMYWLVEPPPMEGLPVPPKNSKFRGSLGRSWAFSQKEFFVTLRNIPLLVLSILVSTVTIFAMCVGIGNPPSRVPFGVINQELEHGTCANVSNLWEGDCSNSPIYLSCKFLSHVKTNEFVLNYYGSTEEAIQDVKLGYTLGYIQFPSEFSTNFNDRAVAGLEVDLDILNKSDITIRMDKSNHLLFQYVNHAWLQVFQRFIKTILTDCGLDPRLGDYSLQYKKPIFGNEDITFRDYAIPSNFIGTMFFWPVITTGIRYVSEKRQGTLKRSRVAGLQLWEVFMGYAVVETGTGILRTILFYVMAQYLFHMQIVGSILLQVLLGVLSIYTGTAGGIMLGAVCSEEIQVALLSMAIFLSTTMLSSQVWPIESIRPVAIQTICNYLPGTMACEAMRSMWSRGWGFSHPNVWPGFVSNLVYILFFLLVTWFILKLKRDNDK